MDQKDSGIAYTKSVQAADKASEQIQGKSLPPMAPTYIDNVKSTGSGSDINRMNQVEPAIVKGNTATAVKNIY